MTETKDHAPSAHFYQGAEDTIKGSERFFDLLKLEQDRLGNKIKIAEERARGNSTAVIGAAALVNLLRTPEHTIPDWGLALFGVGVLAALGFSLAILFNRNTTAISPQWMYEEHAALWEEDRPYLEIMQLYQKGLIRNIAELEHLEAEKYWLLGGQNVAVGATLLLLVALLITVIK